MERKELLKHYTDKQTVILKYISTQFHALSEKYNITHDDYIPFVHNLGDMQSFINLIKKL